MTECLVCQNPTRALFLHPAGAVLCTGCALLYEEGEALDAIPNHEEAL